MYGIEVGRVEKLGMDAEVQQAQVEMLLRKDIKIYEDAIASIKTEGLIGDKYVSIDPGGMGDPLKPGDSIIQTQAAVDVGDLISKYAFGDVKKEDPEKK
jgi:phospholipid/cholesterol/gamma-HCH transport system substrate-binding protein